MVQEFKMIGSLRINYLGEYTKFSDNKFVIPGSKKGVALKEINDRAFFSQKKRFLHEYFCFFPKSAHEVFEEES